MSKHRVDGDKSMFFGGPRMGRRQAMTMLAGAAAAGLPFDAWSQAPPGFH